MSSISINIVEVTKETPQFEKQLEDMVQVLCQGLSADPMTLPVMGVPYEVDPKPFEATHQAQLRIALAGSGRVFAALLDTDGVERVVGLGIWFGPGRDFLENEEHVGYWASVNATLSPDTQKWRQGVMSPRYEQLIIDGLGAGVKKELLHLRALAVLPECHQKGIGRKLVQHALSQSEFQGVGSCVETTDEKNLRFYESLGYEVRSQVAMPSPHGDFTMWCLYRNPDMPPQ